MQVACTQTCLEYLYEYEFINRYLIDWKKLEMPSRQGPSRGDHVKIFKNVFPSLKSLCLSLFKIWGGLN